MTPWASQRFWFETSSSGGNGCFALRRPEFNAGASPCEVHGARSGTGIYLYFGFLQPVTIPPILHI